MSSIDTPAGDGRYDDHIEAGGDLLRGEEVAAARAQFEAALALRPDDHKALGLLGLTLFRLSAFEDALPVYEKLVLGEPADSSLRLNLGLVYLKLGNSQRAIEELTRSRELDPSQSRAVSYLGLAHARSGDYASAYQAFLQAGQADLAKEMEQYLSPEVRRAIAAEIATETAAMTVASESAAVDSPVPRDEAVVEPSTDGPPPVEEIEPLSELSAEYQIELGETTEDEASDAAVPKAAQDSRSAISRAVETVIPSSAAAVAAVRSAAGHQPPVSLSEFATARLIRPQDSQHPFEISAGGTLIVRVAGRVMSRTEGVIVSGGELAFEPATRRVRGKHSDEAFGADGRPMFFVSGQGHLVASPLGDVFATVVLDEDILYLREDLVFAFEERVRWENGHLPGSQGSVNMVQFRGEGAVAMRSSEPLLSVKLSPDRGLYVDIDAMAGWVGRVVPQLVKPAAGGKSSATFVECSGEGVVLLEHSTPPDGGVEPEDSSGADDSGGADGSAATSSD